MTLKSTKSVSTFWSICMLLFSVPVFAQFPTVTVRSANPQMSCGTMEYCLDIEFKADTLDQEIFGMNVRFFYDDDVLELIDFRDFQGGYGAVAPNPPEISTSIPAGPALFNFVGGAEFINGAIQLVNSSAPDILLDTAEWTKLFQICFLVDDPTANLDTFCPSMVWDLEQDPLAGGFLAGDDGVVITIVDPDPNNDSYPAFENVVQYNWQYTGNGTPPYGEPVDSTCSNINCTLPLTLLFFKGEARNEGNFLAWRTSDEIRVDGFDVERSLDRYTWRNLGFVKSVGVDGAIAQYSFLDGTPANASNYYRLRQRDVDGKTSFSPIVSVQRDKEVQNFDVMVYPNPATEGMITVQLSSVTEDQSLLRLYNPLGQLVHEASFDNAAMEISIDHLPQGVYLLQIQSGHNTITKKIFIE